MKATAVIELLESRIAPATVLPGGHAVSYTDVDGDVVMVTVSKGTLTPNNFTFDTAFSDSGPQQLQSLLLNDPQFAGAAVSVVAKAVNGVGNGLANVGFIQAKDIDLASVKVMGDLGRIVAGDPDPAAPGLKTLTANSMGLFGTSTQANGGTLRSFITGGIAQITVAGDLRHAELNALNAAGQIDAGFGKITVGGSLVGGSASFSGQIYAQGNIGVVKIGGDIIGGSGASTGQISAGGSIGGILVGGSLQGGTYDAVTPLSSAGSIVTGTNANFDGSVGFIKIGKSLIGGEGNVSGRILIGNTFNGGLKSLVIGGDLAGGNGALSGQVTVNGKCGNAQISGSIIGGSGLYAGRLDFAHAGSFLLKGSIIGGGAEQSGFISVPNAKSVSVVGSIVGGDGPQSGAIVAPGVLNARVGGSIMGGDGALSGSLNAAVTAGTVKVQGSILNSGKLLIGAGKSVSIGGDLAPGPEAGSLSGQIFANSIGSLTIAGSVKTGTAMTTAAAISVYSAGSITIGGSVIGNDNALATISVMGFTNTLESLGNFTVKGRFEHARLFVGNGVTDGFRIGNVTIGGDFIASAIAVGTKAGNDNLYGTSDDTFIEGGANPFSRIASLVIKGQACGTPGGTDSFGIFAEEFGKVVIRGVTLPLESSSTSLGPTGDLTLEFSH